MRFKLTHRDLTMVTRQSMLTRYAIIGDTYSASHSQYSIATGTEHIQSLQNCIKL